MASFQLPSGYSVASFAYDAADELLNYTATDPYQNLTTNSNTGYSYPSSPSTVTHTYTLRGELFNSSGPLQQTSKLPGYPGLFANGAQCSRTQTSCIFDARSGAIRQSAAGTATTSYTYDTAGRQVVENNTAATPTSCTRTFDADNHTIASNTCQTSGPDATSVSRSYLWGPDGHVNQASDQGTGGVTTYHWDGDDLLYYAGGGGIELFVEKLAQIATPISSTPYLTVIDRDWSGTAVQTHSLAGSSMFTPTGQQPYFQYYCCYGKQGVPRPIGWPGTSSGVTPPSTSNAYVIAMSALRTDGYYDGINVFQGVRAYDPNSNQWTTPDAYAGDVRDPMSQHPYMWNGNNPVAYSDPSGYDTTSSNWQANKILLKDSGVKLPKSSSDIFIKGEFNGHLGPVSAGVSITVNITHPSLFLGTQVAAPQGKPKWVKSFKGISMGLSAAGVLGVVNATKPGSDTNQALNGRSTGVNLSGFGLTFEHSWNDSGNSNAFGISEGFNGNLSRSYNWQVLGGRGEKNHQR